jgi:hypothetical protein
MSPSPSVRRAPVDPARAATGATLTRAGLLKLAAAGAAGSALLGVPAAVAAPRGRPAPRGEDVGYLQWGAAAELLSTTFYTRALEARGVTADDRARFAEARAADRRHLAELAGVLGTTAPERADYRYAFPRGTFASRDAVLAFAAEMEDRIVRVYLDGVAETQDPATRLMLGRMLVSDTQHLAAARRLAGRRSADIGIRAPHGLQAGGTWLDRHVRPAAA